MLWLEYPKPHNGRSTRRLLVMSRGAYRGGFEVDLIGRRWQLRLARHQLALWHDHRTLFTWLLGEGIGGFWQPWNRRGYVPTTPTKE